MFIVIIMIIIMKIIGMKFRLNNLTEVQTLHCFGDYYRKDVLGNPDGDDHQNIRNFIQSGWGGIYFDGEALAVK